MKKLRCSCGGRRFDVKILYEAQGIFENGKYTIDPEMGFKMIGTISKTCLSKCGKTYTAPYTIEHFRLDKQDDNRGNVNNFKGNTNE